MFQELSDKHYSDFHAGLIADKDIKVSSLYQGTTVTVSTIRIDSKGGYSPAESDKKPYIEIDLGKVCYINEYERSLGLSNSIAK